jgi:hypothetical protein
MSRVKITASGDVDWLARAVRSIERRLREEKADSVPPWMQLIPHEDAKRLIKGVRCFLSGKEKTLESALKLNQRGRPVNSHKPENLERAEEAMRLRKLGKTWEAIAEKLYGHRSNPPSARYIQILIKRFTPAIEHKQHMAIVAKLRRRQRLRSKTPPRLAPKREEKVRIDAVWIDPNRRLTPQDVKRMRPRRVRKRRNPT